jgi:hypothetical protein
MALFAFDFTGRHLKAQDRAENSVAQIGVGL